MADMMAMQKPGGDTTKSSSKSKKHPENRDEMLKQLMATPIEYGNRKCFF